MYVSTHAEGVTRVLCFSDTKDQYTREAHAEDAAGLTRRLAKLDAQLQVCLRSAVVALAVSHPAILCCVVWQRSGSCTSLCTYVSCLIAPGVRTRQWVCALRRSFIAELVCW